MGKIKVPAQELNTCDLCGRTHNAIGDKVWLEKCIVCGKEYCISCQGSSIYNVYNLEICGECKEKQEVNNYIGMTHEHWLKDRKRFLKDIEKEKK